MDFPALGFVEVIADGGEFGGFLAALAAAESEIETGEVGVFDGCDQVDVGGGVEEGRGFAEVLWGEVFGGVVIVGFEAGVGAEAGLFSEVFVFQGDNTVGFFDEDDFLTADVTDPVFEFAGVGNGGAQAKKMHMRGGEDDGFFPDGASGFVVEPMDFIEDDVVDVGQSGIAGDDLVAKDFGGHNEQRGPGIDNDVSGHDANGVGAEALGKVPVFLVAEGFYGCSIDDFGAVPEGFVDQVVGDQGFAGAGGCGDKDGMVAVDGGDGLLLEGVKLIVLVGEHGCCLLTRAAPASGQ